MIRYVLCIVAGIAMGLAVVLPMKALGVPEGVSSISGMVVVGFAIDVWPRFSADDRPPHGRLGWLAWALVWVGAGVVVAADEWGLRSAGIAAMAAGIVLSHVARRRRRSAAAVDDPPAWARPSPPAR